VSAQLASNPAREISKEDKKDTKHDSYSFYRLMNQLAVDKVGMEAEVLPLYNHVWDPSLGSFPLVRFAALICRKNGSDCTNQFQLLVRATAEVSVSRRRSCVPP
jgi:hypothetical protein